MGCHRASRRLDADIIRKTFMTSGQEVRPDANETDFFVDAIGVLLKGTFCRTGIFSPIKNASPRSYLCL